MRAWACHNWAGCWAHSACWPGWRAVWLALAAQAALLAALAALAAAAPAHPAFLPGLTGLMGLFFASAGCLWVALYAVLMQAASPLQPGVDFSLFQSDYEIGRASCRERV